MTQSDQIHDDLRFVRGAIERQEGSPSAKSILWLWAVYVLVGYTLLDYNERAGGLFLAIGGLVGGVLSWIIGYRHARRVGEMDQRIGRMEALHWGSILMAFVAVAVLAAIHPPLRSKLGGQVLVVAIGLVYFLYGVHKDRHFLWLGPVLIVGAIAISFLHVYPWTSLGAVIALGLVVPTFFGRNPQA